MRIIEIEALKNGAHRNQTGNLSDIPKGWAKIPADMPIPNTFPFVNIEVGEETIHNKVSHLDENSGEYVTEDISYTIPVVTSMTEGVMPEPVPEPAPDPTTAEIIDILLGVE